MAELNLTQSKGSLAVIPKAQISAKSLPAHKRSKKDPPSPVHNSSTISMEILLEEIRGLKPYMEETNKSLNILQEKWSFMDKRVSELEHRVNTVEQMTSTVQNLQREVITLQRQAEELKNRNRRNNLRIYGLAENEEGVTL